MDAVKKLPEENPFYKINNHSGTYMFRINKFHEIPDIYTLVFLGYTKWNEAKQIQFNAIDLPEVIGDPLPSILNSEIWAAFDGDKQWLIYENKRHHILNTTTIETMKKGKKGSLIFKNVKAIELEKLLQGDEVDLNGKLL